MTASDLVLLLTVDFRQRAEFPPATVFLPGNEAKYPVLNSKVIKYRKCVKYSPEERTA